MATQTRYQERVSTVIERIRRLAGDRNLLQAQQADRADVDAVNAEIGRLQWRLARIVQAEQSQWRAA